MTNVLAQQFARWAAAGMDPYYRKHVTVKDGWIIYSFEKDAQQIIVEAFPQDNGLHLHTRCWISTSPDPQTAHLALHIAHLMEPPLYDDEETAIIVGGAVTLRDNNDDYAELFDALYTISHYAITASLAYAADRKMVHT